MGYKNDDLKSTIMAFGVLIALGIGAAIYFLN